MIDTKKGPSTPCQPSPRPSSFVETYERWMSHCLRLAKDPAWREQIWWNVKQLDADTSGLFTGFKEDFLKRLEDEI